MAPRPPTVVHVSLLCKNLFLHAALLANQSRRVRTWRCQRCPLFVCAFLMMPRRGVSVCTAEVSKMMRGETELHEQGAQRLSELWLQRPQEVVVGLEGWPSHKQALEALVRVILQHAQCDLAPIIAGLEEWNDTSAAAYVLAGLRMPCGGVIDCTRFYHIMKHLEYWNSMDRAYEMLDTWWFLATGDDEPRPAVDYWLKDLWSDNAKIATFSRLAEEGGWGEEEEESEEEESDEDEESDEGEGEDEGEDEDENDDSSEEDNDDEDDQKESLYEILSRAETEPITDKGWSLLMIRTWSGNWRSEPQRILQRIKAALDAGKPLNEWDENGWTALTAALPSAMNVVRELLLRGADPNVRDKFGRAPLDMCVTCPGTSEAVAVLLEHGAQVDEALLQNKHKYRPETVMLLEQARVTQRKP